MNPSTLIDDNLMLDYYDKASGLGVTEQLYTARGSQGMGTSKAISTLGINPEN